MLKVCEKYGKQYDVKFNPIKTQCIQFSKAGVTPTNISVTLNDQALTWTSTVKYLGNWISSNLSEEFEVKKKMGIFYGAVNNLSSCFGDVGYKNIMKLFNTHCCFFYGSQAWQFNDKCISDIFIAWNKSVRKLCNLPWRTHVNILPYLADTPYISDQLYLRSIKMISNMTNPVIRQFHFLQGTV